MATAAAAGGVVVATAAGTGAVFPKFPASSAKSLPFTAPSPFRSPFPYTTTTCPLSALRFSASTIVRPMTASSAVTRSGFWRVRTHSRK